MSARGHIPGRIGQGALMSRHLLTNGRLQLAISFRAMSVY